MDGVQPLLEPTHQLHSQVIVTWSSSHIDVVQFCSKFACCHQWRNQGAPLTLRSYGDGVCGGMPMPLPSIEV